MINALTNKINTPLKNASATINGVSQGFASARRDFRDRPTHQTLSGGRIQDIGMRIGAQAASGEQWCAKYIVGRGMRPTDASQPSVATRLKQHGVLGFGLRSTLGALGSLCHIAPEQNTAVHLADAAMAALRFVVIGLAEAVIVALAYFLSAGLQLAYDGVSRGIAFARQSFEHVRPSANKGVDVQLDPGEIASSFSAGLSVDDALGDALQSDPEKVA